LKNIVIILIAGVGMLIAGCPRKKAGKSNATGTETIMQAVWQSIKANNLTELDKLVATEEELKVIIRNSKLSLEEKLQQFDMLNSNYKILEQFVSQAGIDNFKRNLVESFGMEFWNNAAIIKYDNTLDSLDNKLNVYKTNGSFATLAYGADTAYVDFGDIAKFANGWKLTSPLRLRNFEADDFINGDDSETKNLPIDKSDQKYDHFDEEFEKEEAVDE
jgi:hypothetical protein